MKSGALIEPHGLAATYEVWGLFPELICEDLQGCPHYHPEVVETGSITSATTVVFRDEISPHYKEEVWFVARNADGRTKSPRVKLSPCRRNYCRS